jgi:hypothetical protein
VSDTFKQHFKRGDVVQVDYRSTRYIEEWMAGQRAVGPGDVGVVKFASPDSLTMDGVMQQQVTVTFPMIGTFGIHSSNLRIVQKAEQDAEAG